MQGKKELLLAVLLAALTIVTACGGGGSSSSSDGHSAVTKAAYIYNTDTAGRDSFNALLSSNSITVDLVSLSAAETFDFSQEQVIIIGDDTGSLSTWGTTTAINNILNAGKPVLGVGEGGYAYLGKLGLAIGWANGAHGISGAVTVGNSSLSLFKTPYQIAIDQSNNVALYSSPVNVAEIYISNPNSPPAGVTLLGEDSLAGNYYPLISQTLSGKCYELWGFSGSPSAMTAEGKDLFINMVNNRCI